MVGAAEIARMLGVTRQRVNELVRTSSDFPPPEAELSAGRIWSREDVERWIREHRMDRGGVIVTEVAGVVIIEPSEYDQMAVLAERFLRSRPVLVDLRQVDVLLTRRAIDFCAGLVYGRRGQIETLSERLVLLSPAKKPVDAQTRAQLSRHLAGEGPASEGEP